MKILSKDCRRNANFIKGSQKKTRISSKILKKRDFRHRKNLNFVKESLRKPKFRQRIAEKTQFSLKDRRKKAILVRGSRKNALFFVREL